MRGLLLTLALLAMPVAAQAQEITAATFGSGLLCPKTSAQVSFYTENNQQDAAGTITYALQGGFTVTSDSVRDLPTAGVLVVPSLCNGGMPGLRIDAKRDGWLKAGTLWLPPNQEWDYAEWAELLHKSAIWKPLGPVQLYQGTMEAPSKDKPYPDAAPQGEFEIYPIKFFDDFALVLVDETTAFEKGCAGAPAAPEGKLGWMRLSSSNGIPVAVPAHPRGC
jgi:hypothetical protein